MPERVSSSILTLSEAPSPEQEHARVAAYIDRELYAIERLNRRRLAALARARLDRLFDYVLGGS